MLKVVLGAVMILGSPLALAVPSGAAEVPASHAKVYYIDCSRTSAGDGSAAAPWNSLAAVESTVFAPGSMLLLARGSTCDGTLEPGGSGTALKPITISAYGKGALPVVDGGSAQEAILLDNQQHWTIKNVETTGGSRYGILVEGDSATPLTLSGIRISDVVVTDVSGEASTATGKDSGLIYMSASGEQTFHDVTVSHALAYGTSQWGGIVLRAGEFPSNRGSDITVKDSIVHDVGGDGILIGEANDAKSIGNVAYNTGMIMSANVAHAIGTPSAIWDFNCHNCLVKGNVAFDSHSAIHDGGDYDIDTASDHQTVIGNFGGPSDGYCGSIFSSYGMTDHDGTFADNVCVGNGTSVAGDSPGSESLPSQGAILLNSFGFNGVRPGCLDGVNISGNTVYWEPTSVAGTATPLIQARLNPGPTYGQALFCGSTPDSVKDNTFVAENPDYLNSGSPLQLDHNTYVDVTGQTPQWEYNQTTYTSFGAYQQGSGQDGSSCFVDLAVLPGPGGIAATPPGQKGCHPGALPASGPAAASQPLLYAERLGSSAGPLSRQARTAATQAWRQALVDALDLLPGQGLQQPGL